MRRKLGANGSVAQPTGETRCASPAPAILRTGLAAAGVAAGAVHSATPVARTASGLCTAGARRSAPRTRTTANAIARSRTSEVVHTGGSRRRRIGASVGAPSASGHRTAGESHFSRARPVPTFDRVRYLAVACDFDGTIAIGGRAPRAVVDALGRVRATGRRAILATGRRLDDLIATFPEAVHAFDRIVFENGAALYRPIGAERRLLADRPPPTLAATLRERGVDPLDEGDVVVATSVPNEHVALDAIRDLKLDVQIVFNRESVMLLPSGVNKATGLAAALRELGMSPHEAVGIGDAENDVPFLASCECAVAVANAVPSVLALADLVTTGEAGDGFVELVDELIRDDLRGVEPRLHRRDVLLGHDDGGAQVHIPPYGRNVLVAGPSGSGKSTLTTAVLERLVEQSYQFCIVDPEGDYTAFEQAISLGDAHRTPSITEVMRVLENPDANVAVNLLGVRVGDRPELFERLLPNLQAMRARTGRPHWIVIDEAHHLLPSTWGPISLTFPQKPGELLLITTVPEEIAPPILASIDLVIAVGPRPDATIRSFCRALDRPYPSVPPTGGSPGEVVVWARDRDVLQRVRATPGRAERIRHRRKYAEGTLGPDKSFYFRGPTGAMRLRARNLLAFVEIAEGIDDETWTFHLHAGDYSRWLHQAIKDEALAAEIAVLEHRADLPAAESRERVCQLVRERYTLPG